MSDNPVDIVGARAAGMQAVWVDRGASGFGWADRLVEGEEGRPTAVVRDLTEIVRVIRGISEPKSRLQEKPASLGVYLSPSCPLSS